MPWPQFSTSVFMFTKHVLSHERMQHNPASLISLSSLQKGIVSSGKNGLLLSPMLTPPPLNSDNRHCQPANKTLVAVPIVQAEETSCIKLVDGSHASRHLCNIKGRGFINVWADTWYYYHLTKSYILWVLWTTESYWLLLYTVKYWDCCLPFFVLITR